MGGRSKLFSEVGGAPLNTTQHDNQTLDIRELETRMDSNDDAILDIQQDIAELQTTSGQGLYILGNYAAGMTIENDRQYVRYNGDLYHWTGDVPFTTTGSFFAEAWWTGGAGNVVELPLTGFAEGTTVIPVNYNFSTATVYFNGQRMVAGEGNDVLISPINKTITFNHVTLSPSDVVIVVLQSNDAVATNLAAIEQAAVTAKEEIQQILDNAGDQSTLVALASSSENNGDKLVAHIPYDTNAGSSRTVASKLNESRSILDWPADSADDDSSRFTKAIAAGVTCIYIPSSEVLTREIGRSYLLIKNVDIPLNLLIWGDGKAGYRHIGGPIRVRDDADYGFYFCGTGNGTTDGVRVIGSGLVGISMQGQTTANSSIFVKVLHASAMEFNNVSFRNGGTALYLQDFMESRIINCFFHSIGSETSNVIHIGDYVGAPAWNVNNLHIENCTFGSNSGYLIYMSDSANADLIWIQGNKFEWDSTPTNANSTNKSVIYAGKVERLYVVNNGFVYFYPSHNLYETILKVGVAAAYGIQFLGNMAWGCENAYFWQVLGGSVLARGNRSNARMNVLVSSIHSQDIEPPLIREPTGNRPTSYFAKMHDVNFIPCHYLTGAQASNNFTVDSDAVINGTCQLAAASVELRRAIIPKDMVASGRVIKVTARCKNTNGTDAQIRLICDGATVANYNSSLDDQATYLKIPASSGWANYSWYLTPAMITNGGRLIITNASTTTFLFDGVSIEYATSIDLTIPWSTASIAANTTSNTTVYMSRLGPYIKGVSMPQANGTLGGAIATAYFNGDSSVNNLILQVARVGSTAATVAATSLKVRVFL
ncbi:non-contractile tail fiber protein [Escherichia phage EP_H11]|nr:non-contractile tail fiber protein [Escherichia phage EP_H11]